MSHGSYPDFLLFFFPRGFLWQVFSGLRSNRTSVVSDCSAPVLLYYYLLLLAFFTCTIFLYLGLENNSACDIMCVFMGIYVQSCGHPSLTGLICLCTLIYVQSCGHPSLTGLICLCTGIYVQSCGLPSLTGLICLYIMIFVQSSGYPSLNGTMVAYRDWSKVVDSSDYVHVLVACLFLCSVKRICISERFWSRVVAVRCKVFFFFALRSGIIYVYIRTRQICVL